LKLTNATSLSLKCCLFAGIILLIAGLILSEQDYGDKILWTGALVLIASPFVGVLVTYAHLIAEKDWKWVKVATILALLIIVFLILSLILI
jgi:cell division protein FtsW (lipid II flippase)